MPSPHYIRRLTPPAPRHTLRAEYVYGGTQLPTSARSGSSGYVPNASGSLVNYAANNPVVIDGEAVWCQPAATNIIQRSQEFDNAYWTKNTGVTVSANATTAPDGTLTADKLISANSTIRHSVHRSVTLTTAALSVYAKAAEYDYLVLDSDNTGGAVFNLSNGTISTAEQSASIEALADGWYRCSIVNSSYSYAAIAASSDGTTSSAGDGTSGIYIWGAQVEETAFVTSYIPTTSSSAAVSATIPLVPWPAGLVNDFVVKLTVDDSYIASGGRIIDWYLDNNNTRSVFWNANNNLRIQNFIAGVITNSSGSEMTISDMTGVSHEQTIWFSSTQGKKLYAGQTKAVDWANTVDLLAATNMALGFTQRFNAAHATGKRSNIRIFKVSPGITPAEVLAL